MDYNGIDEVLLKNSLGEDKKTTKLDILMRVVKNIINIKDSSHEPKNGYICWGKCIRKTYKTVFLFHVRTDVIQSVYVLSKDDATEEAMDAWINQIAFVMKYMIVPLVESQIEETAA
jgi:hypothetical protein